MSTESSLGSVAASRSSFTGGGISQVRLDDVTVEWLAGPCYDRLVDDDDLFRRAVAGVEPLDEGPGKVLRSPPRKAAPRPRQLGGRFEIERLGEHVEGLAKGGDRRRLRQLQRGEIEVDLRLDLHGLSQEGARQTVEAAVELAHFGGQRCLLVIHGRGHHSEAGPVLKEALPHWLTGPRCAVHVMAFSSAPPELGGAGATLVLLRRRR